MDGLETVTEQGRTYSGTKIMVRTPVMDSISWFWMLGSSCGMLRVCAVQTANANRQYGLGMVPADTRGLRKLECKAAQTGQQSATSQRPIQSKAEERVFTTCSSASISGLLRLVWNICSAHAPNIRVKVNARIPIQDETTWSEGRGKRDAPTSVSACGSSFGPSACASMPTHVSACTHRISDHPKPSASHGKQCKKGR